MTTWLLSCGHTAPMLEHDRADVLPPRPRRCERCGRLRDVEAPVRAGAGEVVCAECGRTSSEGDGWRAELGVDLEDEREPDEVAVYCPECWGPRVRPRRIWALAIAWPDDE